MFKKINLFVLLGMLVLSPKIVFASETEILVDKLVEKGVLSKVEAEDILEETKVEVKKQEEQKKKEDLKSKMNFKGDFRLRYENIREQTLPDRERERIRVRMGIEPEINDKVKFGVGIATGSGDPRSTNQTLDNTFESKDVRFDYAYVAYKPVDEVNILGGKFKNPLWTVSDLMWDSDINPEGLAVKYDYDFDSGINLFVNAGIFVLDEKSASKSDPYMIALQVGANFPISEQIELKAALTGYDFAKVKGTTLDWSSGTNTLENGVLKYKYNSLNPSFELGINDPIGNPAIPYAALLGEYIYNPDPDHNNQGFLAGFKVGHKKIKEFGKWEFKYLYRYLQKDACPDVFPDSDAYGGKTDVKGHEFIFNYGLGKNCVLGLDYYYMDRLFYQTSGDENQQVFQVDLNFYF